ncbi:MAG: transposase [Thermoprotei archaeon]|nr:MAG: transposase [Thermoprotei archaeon]
MVQENSLRIVKAYRLKHIHDVSQFITDYLNILRYAIWIIWNNISWKNDKPILPSTRGFKRKLRSELKSKWCYASHYVDSAIKQAYSIMKSWRKRYIKGKAEKRTPVIKRRFVRIKNTLFTYNEGVIKITIKPYEEYLVIDLSPIIDIISRDLSKNPCKSDIGELILKDNEVVITIRKNFTRRKVRGFIAWDVNLRTLDGLKVDLENNTAEWIRYDISYLHHVHRVYEIKRRKIQKKLHRKQRLMRRLLRKYSRRESNRVNDYLHKLTSFIVREFNEYDHVFEDLTYIKDRIASTRSRRVNRVNAKHDYRKIQKMIEYKALWNGCQAYYVKPHYTSRTCPKCGFKVKTRIGQVLTCPRCGFKADRQFVAVWNIAMKYLQMWGIRGLPESPQRVMTPQTLCWGKGELNKNHKIS